MEAEKHKKIIGISKSAIQKAIRRGNIAILKKCFGYFTLYEKSWLDWRFPVLVVEENWEMLLTHGERIWNGVSGKVKWIKS